MNEILMNSYKRRLKALLAGIIFLIGAGLIIRNKGDVINIVNKRYINENNCTQTYTYVEQYTSPVQYVYDDAMYVDETQVYQEGKPGNKCVTVMSVYENGIRSGEQVLDREIVKEAVPEIIVVGTKEKPDYIIPVENYVITSMFGPRWGSTHHGVDLGVPVGTEVMAARDGVVIQTGWNGELGISVSVEHEDKTITRYAHLSESLVQLGDEVQQGEIIAHSGNTGFSTGPHLHFEVRVNGEAVNPLDYLDEY